MLVLALWIALILSLMAYSISYELGLNMKMARQSQESLKARGLARAGVAKAVMDLRNDRLLQFVDSAQMLTDSFNDVWALQEDKTEIELDDGTYTVMIEDEAGKLNINKLELPSTPILAYLIHELGDVDEREAGVIACMVVDWVDPDFIPSCGFGAHEVGAYTEWALENLDVELPADWVFEPKNDKFLNLEELIEIPGITRELMYGDHDDREEWDDMAFIERREESPFLADHLTVYSLGGLNVNTCSRVLLEGVFATAHGNKRVGQDIAKLIIEYRADLSRNEGASGSIMNVKQLVELDGINDESIQNLLYIFKLNVRSQYFTIISRGDYHGYRKTLQMRVRVNVEPYAIDPANPDTYGLRDRRASGLLRSRPANVIDPAVRVVEIKEI